jgi:hypothetical protein
LVIPLFVLLAVRALGWLWADSFGGRKSLVRAARVAGAVGLGLWLLYYSYAMGIVDASRASIAGFDELTGAYNQIQGLAERLDPTAVIVFSAGRDEPAAIATPLRFIFGRDAFVTVFNNPPGDKVAGMIDGWRAQGRDVILAYGTNGGKLQVPGYALVPQGEFGFDVPQWAFAYDFMPRSPWRVNLNYALYRAVPQNEPPEYPFVLNFGGSDFPFLASGFLERAPEAQTRWIGTIASDARTREAKWVSAAVRFPIAKGEQDLKLTVTARAPRQGVRLQLKSGESALGSVLLGTNPIAHTVTIERAGLKTVGNTYVLEFVSQTTLEDGRLLGAGLEELRVESAP